MAQPDRKQNIDGWIEANKASFKPPVCNKLMHAGELKIMFVGGPNQRRDYHLEEGEELFFQVQGPMCVKIVEQNKYKDVHIKQGQMFILPSRIPHSPQRFADTVGLVVERERLKDEFDCLRYYSRLNTENPPVPAWERYFYCHDLGVQLPPVINEYFASDTYTKPDEPTSLQEAKVQVDVDTVVPEPFDLKEWIQGNDLKSGPKDINTKGEFKIRAFGQSETPYEADAVYAEREKFLWQFDGTSQLTIDGAVISLAPSDSYIVPPNTSYKWLQDSASSVGISIIVDPLACRTRPLPAAQ